MARRRRQVLDDSLRFDAPVGAEEPAAPPLEGEGYDDWLSPSVSLPSDEGAVEFPDIARSDEYVVSDPVSVEEKGDLSAEVSAKRDYGNWIYTPWRGRDMWRNKLSGNTSFDEQAVRRFRHQKDLRRPAIKVPGA